MPNEVSVCRAVATLTDGSELATPFWRIQGGRDGHHLVLLAAQHGNEVQGTEIARRFCDICATDLAAGTVTLVPFANLPAIRHRRITSDIGPEQGKRDCHGTNMQQTWPGNAQGNDIERIAYALDAEVMSTCDRLVDIHCWSHYLAAAVLGHADQPDSVLMAEATGLRFAKWRPAPKPSAGIRSSSALICSRGGACIELEMSGQYQIVEEQVRKGVQLMVNVARVLKMMPGEPEVPDGPMVEPTPDTEVVITAPCSGMFMDRGLAAEDWVEQGQRLGHILRDDTLETVEIGAPVSGYLFRYRRHGPKCDVRLPDQHPYADAGDVLASIVKTPS